LRLISAQTISIGEKSGLYGCQFRMLKFARITSAQAA
jgi:hypothetical protein